MRTKGICAQIQTDFKSNPGFNFTIYWQDLCQVWAHRFEDQACIFTNAQ